jgi:beta-galactosidase
MSTQQKLLLKKISYNIVLVLFLLVGLVISCRFTYTQKGLRERTKFDFNWKFIKGDVKGSEDVSFNDESWRTVNVPHDWSIEGPFSEDNSSGTGYLPGGIGWYRKSFQLPREIEGKRVVIEFDGVYMNSEVWINGHYLGKRPFGYISFYYDLTPYLKYGNEKNVIAVRVEYSKVADSRWYAGAGIYRHVWLIITDKLHVDHWGTYVITPEVSNESSTVEIRTKVKNEYDIPKKAVLITTLVDKDNKVLNTVEASSDIAENSGYEFSQTVEVERPNLWSPDNPYLYRVYTTVKDEEKAVDDYETPLGIREFYFDPDSGFFLNGENMKIKGTCNHHDCGPLGAAVPDQALRRRLEILKEMGCNAIRTSHNPPAPELLDMCDELGFLVMDEAFDEWARGKKKWMQGRNVGREYGMDGLNKYFALYGYNEYFEEWEIKDIQDMVKRDRNHPSIILWSIGNEIDYPNDPYADPSERYYEPGRPSPVELVDIAKRLVKAVKEIDTTRPVTAALSNMPVSNKTGLSEVLDVVGYNYQERFYEEDHKNFPNRKIVGSENGDSYGAWLTVRDNDYVSGQFLWTGFDYLGEAGRFPNRSSSAGLIDLCGFRKPSFYFRQSLWTNTPMVYIVSQAPLPSEQEGQRRRFPRVFSHWNWEGREGETIVVTSYTNCESVELLLNGKSLGSKELSASSDLNLLWSVPYESGTLKAIGRNDGKIVCMHELHTAGSPSKITLTPDRNTIVADNSDLSHIEVNVVDEKGNKVPYANNLITFNIIGEGKIIGVGNGDPQSLEDFKSNKRKAYNGECLVIIQSSNNPGEIQLTATSPGLLPSSITINSKSQEMK